MTEGGPQAHDWLGEGPSSVQQQALRDFDRALANWWAGTHRRPRWRRAGVDEGFCVRDVTVRLLNRRWATVHVPKCGPVRFRLSRPLPAMFEMGRVTLDRAGRWHVSFAAPQPTLARQASGRQVGVDLGVAATATLCDGRHLHAPGLRPGEAQRLRRLQRQMARQHTGSARRARTKRQVARLKAREADRRRDFVEQTTTRLVRELDLVAVEDLAVANMVRSAAGTVDQPGRQVAQKRSAQLARTR